MILKPLISKAFWQWRPSLMALLTLLTLLWFNLGWALESSFRCFSTVQLWVFNLLLAMLLAGPALAGHKLKAQALIISLLAIWMEANLIYFRGYFSAIPPSSYLLVGNVMDFTSSVTELIHPWPDLGFAAVIAAAWVIACRKGNYGATNPLVWLAWTGILALAAAVTIIPDGSYTGAWHKRSNYHYHAARVPMFTVPGWIAFSLMDSNAPLSDADRQRVNAWLTEHSRLATPAEPTTRPKALVMVLVESMESWPIGLQLEGETVMPNLTALVADTARTYFAPNVISQVGAGRSIDAQLLTNVGLYPMTDKTWAFDYIDNSFPSLSGSLTAAGTPAYLMTPDRPSTWNQQAVVDRLGYTHALYGQDWEPGERFGHPRKNLGDRALLRQVAARLDTFCPPGQPFAVVAITMSTHNPWQIPDSIRSLTLKGDYAHPVKPYLESLRYADEALGRFVSDIYSRPDSADIVTVIMGDHEGLMTYRAEAAKRHPFVTPYEAVPLIVINGPMRGHDLRFMGQVDIYPTLLDIMGASPRGDWRGMGFSILSPSHPGAAVNLRGQMFGAPADSAVRAHLMQAPRVSQLILQHNLLKR